MVPDSHSKSKFAKSVPSPSAPAKQPPIWQDLASLELSPKVLRQGGRSLFGRPVGWAIGGLGLLLLLLWDGRLVLATAAGIATMLTIYQLRNQGGQAWQVTIRQWLQIWNQPLMFATAIGVGASFLTYLAISIWLDLDQHWLATGLLLQGLTSVGLLGLFIWQRWEQGSQIQQDQFKTAIAALASPQPLTRLAAVQALTQGILDGQWQARQLQQIVAAFRLLLDHEAESVIQEALWDGLQALNLKASPTETAASRTATGQSLQQLAAGISQPMATVPRSFQSAAQPAAQPAARKPVYAELEQDFADREPNNRQGGEA